MSDNYSSSVISLTPKDDEATRFIDQWVTAAQKIRSTFEPQWAENWANYRVEPYLNSGGSDYVKMDPYSSRKPSGINSLKSPESHQVANTLTAVLMSSLLGVRDYIQAVPVGDEDYGAGRKVSKLLMYGLDRQGNYRSVYEELKDAVIFGSGFYKAVWNRLVRTVPRRMPVTDPMTGEVMIDPETGVPITLLQNASVPVIDDVSIVPVALTDLWLDPAATRMSDCLGVVERFRMSRDDCKSHIGQPGWESDGLRKVLGLKPSEWSHGPGDESPKLTIEGLTREDIKHIEAFGYYGGYQYTGMLPSEVAKKLELDPSTSNTVAIINGVIVQKAQNTEMDGRLPYGSISILPTGGQMYGLSPLTVIRYLQDISDTQLILNTQASIEAVYQNYIVGGAASTGPDFNRRLMNRKPREVFDVPGDVTQIVPLPRDYTGLQIAAGNLASISAAIRDASAARDPVQGTMGNDRTTATEAQLTSSAALQGIDQLASLIERDELPLLGSLIYGLYYINLEDEGRVIRRVGDKEAEHVGFWDISGQFDVSFVGARQALSKAQRSTAFKELVQAASMNPMFAAQFNFDEYVLRLADEVLDIKGANELIQTDPEEVIARLQAMGIKGPIGGGGTAGKMGESGPGPSSSDQAASEGYA